MALIFNKNKDGSISYKDDKDSTIAFTVKNGKVIDGNASTTWEIDIKVATPAAKKPQQQGTRKYGEDELYKAQTEEGRITPTGKSSDAPPEFKTAQDQIDWYKKWGIADPKLNNAGTQGQIYDKADPYWRAAMWGSYGDTAKGATRAKYPEWVYNKGESLDQYKKRMQEAGWTPEKMKAETDKLRPNFIDEKSGPREAWLAFKLEDKPETPVIETPETKDIVPNPPGAYRRARADSPWWIQDVINTASAAGTRFGLKKYMPWAPTIKPVVPDYVFKDPTRELASNAEQMAIGTQGAGLFAGPQAYNARFSQIAGQGAKNAADILGKYQNYNVGIANQFEGLRANIYNRANEMNAKSAKNLYDGVTMANQQFDNSKRQANNELRETYVNAITNRAKTQALNSIYPNYQIDTARGGRLEFYDGTDINPTAYQDKAKQFKDLMNDPRMDPETARIISGIEGGKTNTTQQNVDAQNILANFPQAEGGEPDSDIAAYRELASIFE